MADINEAIRRLDLNAFYPSVEVVRMHLAGACAEAMIELRGSDNITRSGALALYMGAVSLSHSLEAMLTKDWGGVEKTAIPRQFLDYARLQMIQRTVNDPVIGFVEKPTEEEGP